MKHSVWTDMNSEGKTVHSYQTGETSGDISLTRLRSTKFRQPSPLVVLQSGLGGTLCPHWCVAVFNLIESAENAQEILIQHL